MRIPVFLDHFNVGIISDEVVRPESDFYKAALKECENGNISPFGNIRKRPGTKYIANINCSKARFIPFTYSSSQAYAVLFVTNHDGVAEDNRVYFFTLDGFVVDAEGDPYYLTSPYDDSVDLNKIQYAQKDDVMYLALEGFPIWKLTRFAENIWDLQQVNFSVGQTIAFGDGMAYEAEGYLPLEFIEPGHIELHYTIAGHNYTVVDNGGHFSGTNIVESSIDYNNGRIYIRVGDDDPGPVKAWDAAARYRNCVIQVDSGWLFRCVYSYGDGIPSGDTPPWHSVNYGGIVYNGDLHWKCIRTTFDSGTPIYVKFTNIESSGLKAGAITFHQNRLVCGNIENGPQTFCSSVVGAYETINFGDTDSDSYIFTIASEENNEIRWITSSSVLLIGTQGGDFVAQGGDKGITSDDIKVTKQSNYGAKAIQPLHIGSNVVYVQALGNRVFASGYDWQSNSFISRDMNLLNSPGLLDEGVSNIFYEREPWQRVWCLLKDGSAAIATFLPGQKIIAWQKYTPGGNNAKIITACAISLDQEGFSKVYMLVDRDGVKYIESSQNPSYSNYFDVGFSDSYVYLTVGEATNVFTVPFHDGSNVSVFTDKGVHPDVEVNGGQITLQWEVTSIIAGFPYTEKITTVPVEINNGQINTIGKKKSAHNVKLLLKNSIDGAVGMNDNNNMIYLTSYDITGYPLPLVSGFKEVALTDAIAHNMIWFTIVHDRPTPFNLLGISFDMEVGS